MPPENFDEPDEDEWIPQYGSTDTHLDFETVLPAGGLVDFSLNTLDVQTGETVDDVATLLPFSVEQQGISQREDDTQSWFRTEDNTIIDSYSASVPSAPPAEFMATNHQADNQVFQGSVIPDIANIQVPPSFQNTFPTESAISNQMTMVPLNMFGSGDSAMQPQLEQSFEIGLQAATSNLLLPPNAWESLPSAHFEFPDTSYNNQNLMNWSLGASNYSNQLNFNSDLQVGFNYGSPSSAIHPSAQVHRDFLPYPTNMGQPTATVNRMQTERDMSLIGSTIGFQNAAHAFWADMHIPDQSFISQQNVQQPDPYMSSDMPSHGDQVDETISPTRIVEPSQSRISSKSRETAVERHFKNSRWQPQDTSGFNRFSVNPIHARGAQSKNRSSKKKPCLICKFHKKPCEKSPCDRCSSFFQKRPDLKIELGLRCIETDLSDVDFSVLGDFWQRHKGLLILCDNGFSPVNRGWGAPDRSSRPATGVMSPRRRHPAFGETITPIFVPSLAFIPPHTKFETYEDHGVVRYNQEIPLEKVSLIIEQILEVIASNEFTSARKVSSLVNMRRLIYALRMIEPALQGHRIASSASKSYLATKPIDFDDFTANFVLYCDFTESEFDHREFPTSQSTQAQDLLSHLHGSVDYRIRTCRRLGQEKNNAGTDRCVDDFVSVYHRKSRKSKDRDNLNYEEAHSHAGDHSMIAPLDASSSH